VQPTGPNGKLWIIDHTPREPVEEIVHADLNHFNIFISETAVLATSLGFTNFSEVKKNAFRSAARVRENC
jgi:RIO-like serine/threonine protein kinase